MKYVVIGLGNYGYALAESLASIGHEVIGVDIEPGRIESLKDQLSMAMVMDATDEHALAALPLHAVDAVIVGIGENFGASVRVTALLKQMKVPHIFARANDEVHRSILQAFGIERLLTPEADAAHVLVELMEYGWDIETFKVDAEHAVFKFAVPSKMVGFSVEQLSVGRDYGLQVLATICASVQKNLMGINYTEHNVLSSSGDEAARQLQEGDQLVLFGTYANFRKFWNGL